MNMFCLLFTFSIIVCYLDPRTNILTRPTYKENISGSPQHKTDCMYSVLLSGFLGSLHQ